MGRRVGSSAIAAGVLCLGIAGVALGAPEMSSANADAPAWMCAVPGWAPEWLPRVAGRSHVVLVHFPVALLMVAALCEVWSAARRRDEASIAGLTCLVLGALGAAASAASGWINADLEGSRASMAETLTMHRWVGVAAAGCALLTALVIAPLLRTSGRTGAHAHARGPLGAYRAGVVIAAALVGVAGHLGGSLVHGEDYFWSVINPEDTGATNTARADSEGAGGTDNHTGKDSAKEDAWPMGMARQAGTIDFEMTIRPIFEAHCVECHGAFKKKGGLRLDRRAGAFNRQPKDWTIVPGKPEASDVLRRVMLPPNDPDFMPDGDKPLNPDEVAALRTWIAEGAYWPGEAPQSESAIRAEKEGELREQVRETFGGSPFLDTRDPLKAALATKKDTEAAKTAIDAIRAKRGVVVELGGDDSRLSVDLSVTAPPIADADLRMLDALRPRISWLNLSRTAITDAGLATLKNMSELERVRIEWTAIGDSGLEFAASCAKLRQLNLVGTKVTDEGLAKLAACASLRKVFVWKSGVTPEGIAKFRSAHPDVEVVEGTP